jgi:hypothetical protein
MRPLAIREKAKLLGQSIPMWRLFAKIWRNFIDKLVKKMKPRGWKNVREESGPINEGDRSLVCQ